MRSTVGVRYSSGPPMIQIGKYGWFFQLRSTPTKIAPASPRRREHFEALQVVLGSRAKARCLRRDSFAEEPGRVEVSRLCGGAAERRSPIA